MDYFQANHTKIIMNCKEWYNVNTDKSMSELFMYNII